MMTKQAHAEALQKVAAVEKNDRAAAFEVGFAKCAQDMDLNEAQYQKLYRIALEIAKGE